MYVSRKIVALAAMLWVLNCAVLGGIVAVGTKGDPGIIRLQDPWPHLRCYFHSSVGLAGCQVSWGPTYFRYEP